MPAEALSHEWAIVVDSACHFDPVAGPRALVAIGPKVLDSTCSMFHILYHPSAQFRVSTEDEFELDVKKFQVVIVTAAKSLPRGHGMETAKKLYEDLDRKGILPVPELEARS